MCTRYYMELSPELRPYIDRAFHSPLKDRMVAKMGRPLVTECEVRPTDIAPVVTLIAPPSIPWSGVSQIRGKAESLW